MDTSQLACLISAGLWTSDHELTQVAGRSGKAASSVDAKEAFLVRGMNETEIMLRLAALTASE